MTKINSDSLEKANKVLIAQQAKRICDTAVAEKVEWRRVITLMSLREFKWVDGVGCMKKMTRCAKRVHEHYLVHSPLA